MPCSACDSRSAATNSGLLVSSAITQTSLGPAGMSIATSCSDTCCLAAITNWLPGPNILYTLGTDSVPYAIAPIACTPPALNILLTPATFAAISMAGCTLPSLFGGVQSTISLHPAILAGVASISTVENNGAVPPGIYSPTFSIATLFCQQVTPLAVSTFSPSNFCDSWNLAILSWASTRAFFSSSSTRFSASAISSSVTARVESFTLSNFSS